MRRSARFVLTAVIAATPVLGLAVPAQLMAQASAAVTTVNHVRLNGFEARLAMEVNGARRAAGLRPLRVTPGTTDVARRWAQTLAGAQSLWHNPHIVRQMEHHGSNAWTDIAENVGYGPATQPSTLFSAYMHSPEHRANILDPQVRYLGVGVVERDGLAYNTLDFTDAYSTSYGPSRVPPAALTMDATQLAAGASLTRLASGTAGTFTSHSHGSVHASAVRYGSAGAAATVLRKTRGGSGHGTLVLSRAMDFAGASTLSLRLAARHRSGHRVPVHLTLTRAFAPSVTLATVRVGQHAGWVTVTLPAAAQSMRDALVLTVTAHRVHAAGGRVRLAMSGLRTAA